MFQPDDERSAGAARVAELERLVGQQALVNRRVRTTNSDHPFPRYPNRVADRALNRPAQVWVADITYVRVRVQFVYLAAVMDVFTRRVRGWEVTRSLDQGLTLGALRRAPRRGGPEVHQ